MTEENRRLLTPQRLEGETREEYKARRKAVGKAIKQYLKGRTVWNPRLPIPYEGKMYVAGPYVKELHGPLVSGLDLTLEEALDGEVNQGENVGTSENGGRELEKEPTPDGDSVEEAGQEDGQQGE